MESEIEGKLRKKAAIFAGIGKICRLLHESGKISRIEGDAEAMSYLPDDKGIMPGRPLEPAEKDEEIGKMLIGIGFANKIDGRMYILSDDGSENAERA